MRNSRLLPYDTMLMYGREAQDMDSQPCHYSEVRGTQ